MSCWRSPVRKVPNRDWEPELSRWFRVEPSLWLEAQEYTQSMATEAGGGVLPDDFWSTTWPLTTGRYFPGPLKFQALPPPLKQSSTSRQTWWPHWLLQMGLDAEENPSWSLGIWQGLGAEGHSLTLSSRSSFPRNPLDAKMGIPGNTVLEVMV